MSSPRRSQTPPSRTFGRREGTNAVTQHRVPPYRASTGGIEEPHE